MIAANKSRIAITLPNDFLEVLDRQRTPLGFTRSNYLLMLIYEGVAKKQTEAQLVQDMTAHLNASIDKYLDDQLPGQMNIDDLHIGKVGD